MTEWLPAPRPEVARLAWPEPFKVALPRVLPPSVKVTVPVGVPDPPVTVAVKVTASPKLGVSSETIRAVVVGATTWVTAMVRVSVKEKL